MKLISATVRNYRIHQNTRIDFDPARTLIGGPNESGKSTLIEAIHRGLFLKSTVSGEARNSMVSTLYPDHPEVEIHFEAGGIGYKLTKRFSGTNGTTQLLQMGGGTRHGEEAESQLAELLGVEELGGGRGILGRVGQQWSHLWVWQGMSGYDPSEHAAPPPSDLLRQLQESGGVVAMQSELDGRVASRFAHSAEQIFVRNGKAKSGSDLDTAQTNAQQAAVHCSEAKNRLEKLRQAIQDVETAMSTIERTETSLGVLNQQLQEVNDKIAHAAALQQIERDQDRIVVSATEKLTEIEGIEHSIEELRSARTTLEASLEPGQEQLHLLESRLAESRVITATIEREHDDSLEKSRSVRLRRDLAAAYVSFFEKQARTNELNSRLERVQALESEITGFRDQLAQLVAMDQSGLEALQDVDNRLAQASAALNAMAAEIEVIASDQPVHIGDSDISAGESQTVTDTTEIQIGDAVRLRIHPGGGNNLSEARERARSLHEELRRQLDEYGLNTIEEASLVLARRIDFESKVEKAMALREGLDAGDLAESCDKARNDLMATEGDVRRRSEQADIADKPADSAAAIAWHRREDEAVRTVESGAIDLKARRDTLHEKQDVLENDSRILRDTLLEEKQTLTGVVANLAMLIEGHGEDKSRRKLIEEARKAKSSADDELSITRQKLEAMRPDVLTSDLDRLQRALKEAERQLRDAQTSQAVSESALRSDGSMDPNVALAEAEAISSAANNHLDAVRRKAEATALVDRLFQEQHRALADRFSQPLAQKITGYLQRLLGPEAHAVVTFEDNAFQRIDLVRSGQDSATSFANLSGGTREQVAAAVRLAIAELLAADHNNSLPIVFDDAFAYSDPERVHTLQRMLDLGASRGLQIIVLSCNPSDYSGLGARQFILPTNGPHEETH